ncbi:putative transmembrane protease, serine 13 [Trichinella spiralis]|uniref:putative transmembrane protease, serine 13 n=1 Tax=Trichinella spiralis TaxID=6334 RepID=UPI0001EFE210|nr:putative transmembrane protease, serine 13 [Trichinella spiralis]
MAKYGEQARPKDTRVSRYVARRPPGSSFLQRNRKHRGPPRASPLAGTFSRCPTGGPLDNAEIEAGFPASQPAVSVPGRAVHSETSLRTSPSHQKQCDASSPLVPLG